MTNNCSRCGSLIDSKSLQESYDEADLEEELRWCMSCIEDVPSQIQELFDRTKEALSEDNAEEYESFGVSMKSAFALSCLEDGVITGGTVGHMESLRTLTASGIEGGA